MKEVNKTNTLLLTVIGVATLLVAVIGATFAFFTANISGNESSTTVTLAAGTLSINYTGGANLSALNIEPQPVGEELIEKDFTITANNSTTAVVPYTLSIQVTANTFTANALTYTLASTNHQPANGSVVTAIPDYTGIPTGVGNVTLGTGNFNGKVTNVTHTYKLKIFFEDTGVPQDEDKNKIFSGYVLTTVEQVYTNP